MLVLAVNATVIIMLKLSLSNENNCHAINGAIVILHSMSICRANFV